MKKTIHFTKSQIFAFSIIQNNNKNNVFPVNVCNKQKYFFFFYFIKRKKNVILIEI